MRAKLSFFIGGMTKVSRIFALVIAIAVQWVATDANAQCGSKNFDEYGVFLGVGYYNGEINPVNPFYKPKPAIGFNLRHVIDNRFGVTFQAIWSELEGSDSDFDNEYQKWRNASFKNQVVELSLQGEINFLPLVPGDDMRCFTPYIAAGPGLVLGSFVDEGLRFCITFGKVGQIPFNARIFIVLAELAHLRAAQSVDGNHALVGQVRNLHLVGQGVAFV
ncbi:MAG: hypothetical protein IIT37_09180 [Bacteroidales bacterium]|nr:hypothetical protein [Bacteroidales bacterium]